MTQSTLSPVARHIRRLVAADAGRELSDSELLARFAASGTSAACGTGVSPVERERAFAALFRRHGPLVWSVCYSVLHHRQDTEDTVQATFLLLARRAGSIRKTEAVASWLYRVAHRVATKAGQTMARRRVARQECLAHSQEKQTDQRQVSPPEAEAAWRELQALLNEEVQRLPEKYRAPFIMCCLEGKTGPEAARQLGWKVGTVTGRLSEARQLVQRRLSRRGVTLSSVLTAATVAHARAATTCAALADGTVKAALAFTTQATTAGLVSAKAAALVEVMAKQLVVTKLKVATALLLAVSVVTGAGLVVHQALAEKPLQDNAVSEKRAEQPPAKTITPKPAAPARAEDKDATKTVTFAGRVVDPDGKPVKDAKLFITTYRNFKLQPAKVRAVSDEDGKYRFTVPTGEFDTSRSPEPWKYTLVLAMADGYGLGLPQYDFSKWSEPFPIDNLTIHLAKDDVPINGRILDLQAKPIAGVRIHVRGIQWPNKGDLTSFVTALKTRKEGFSVQQELLVGIRHPHRGEDLDSLYPPVVTGADGRFRIKGVGRERLADLLIAGPTIETKLVYAMTRPSETITVPYLKDPNGLGPPAIPPYTHYGATFDHVVPPSKPVEGIVRDKETGKPIPGAVIGSYQLAGNRFDERVSFRVIADKDGRYRITGLPYGDGNQIQAGGPPEGKPYVMAIKNVGTSPALKPITLDIELKRGVWITGKITNKATGKPVNCQVDYFVSEDNPHLADAAGLATRPGQDERITEDGRFRVVGLPGCGAIGVRAGDNYLPGVGREGIKHFKPRLFSFYPDNYHAVAEVNPGENAESVTVNLVLDPGKTLTGTILGPDDKPLTGAFANGLANAGLAGAGWNYPALETAEFKMTALKPGESRRLVVVHMEKRLAATLLVRGDEKGPLTIKLEPWGVVTGKLTIPEGKDPTDYRIFTRNSVLLTVDGGVQKPDLDMGDLLAPVKPDKDGKFRIEGLVPGLKYYLQVGRGHYVAKVLGSTNEVRVKSGETKDIGELRVKSIEE